MAKKTKQKVLGFNGWNVVFDPDDKWIDYYFVHSVSGRKIKGVPYKICDFNYSDRLQARLRELKNYSDEEKKQIEIERLFNVYPEIVTENKELPDGELPKLKYEFYKRFNFKIPEENINKRQKGVLVDGAESLKYFFGSDKNGEYIEFVYSNRFSNTRYEKIYETGETKSVTKKTYNDGSADTGDFESLFLEAK